MRQFGLTENRPLVIACLIYVALGIASFWYPTVADEAYYTDWSRKIDFGYFDHPPMVSYLISLFGQRPKLAAWSTTLVSLCILTITAKRLGKGGWKHVPALFLSSPLGLSAALFMTPDIPLLLGSSIFLFGLIHTRFAFILMGLTIGLWSKPTMVLFFPAAFIVLGIRRSILLVLALLITTSPMLVWSFEHDGLPLSFQGSRSFEFSGRSFLRPVETILGQCLIAGPLLVGLYKKVLHQNKGTETYLLRWLCWPTLFVFMLASLGLRIELNWLITMWIPLIVWGPSHSNFERLERGRFPRSYRTICHALIPLLPLVLSYLPMHLGPDRLGEETASCLKNSYPRERLVASRYQEMALLRQFLPSLFLLNRPVDRGSQYQLWGDRVIQQTRSGDILIGQQDKCHGQSTLHEVCGVTIHHCQ